VVVHYEFADGDPHVVALPQSTSELTILDLAVDQRDVHEEFRDGRRWLCPAPSVHSLELRCRYRQYQQRDRHGAPLPFPTPNVLFPAASDIRYGAKDETKP
jgi:hypothetical protein